MRGSRSSLGTFCFFWCQYKISAPIRDPSFSYAIGNLKMMRVPYKNLVLQSQHLGLTMAKASFVNGQYAIPALSLPDGHCEIQVQFYSKCIHKKARNARHIRIRAYHPQTYATRMSQGFIFTRGLSSKVNKSHALQVLHFEES